MSSAHLHLIANHIGILAPILGCLVLIYAMIVKDDLTKIAAYGLFIIASLGAAVTFLTGEGAEHSLKHLAGISRNSIEVHEDAAGVAVIVLIILGVTALSGLIFTIMKSSVAGILAWVTLFISIMSFVLIARVGYLGGQIRHTQLNPPNEVVRQDL